MLPPGKRISVFQEKKNIKKRFINKNFKSVLIFKIKKGE